MDTINTFPKTEEISVRDIFTLHTVEPHQKFLFTFPSYEKFRTSFYRDHNRISQVQSKNDLVVPKQPISAYGETRKLALMALEQRIQQLRVQLLYWAAIEPKQENILRKSHRSCIEYRNKFIFVLDDVCVETLTEKPSVVYDELKDLYCATIWNFGLAILDSDYIIMRG